jgi:outer membrane receptor protein involved in Fe transport
MKIVKSPPVSGINRCIIGGLMVVMSTSGLFAQESQAALIRRLQEENAALRAQFTPTSSAAMQRQSPEEADTIVLSPFEVTTTGDYGYLKTNSLTATRIGARIMDTPLQIQVLSEEFIQDAGLVDLNDVMRYAGTSAGDNAMGVLQPATGFTPSGNISTRGFPINARLRNSVRRYNVYSLDNVERVELIRGPASVFFGQSFPGGVINYVTKQAEFRNIPTSISYRWTTDGGNKATFDQNTVLLEDKVAFRNFVSWENSRFQRDFEFREGFTILPQVKVRISDKLEFRAELEYTKRTENLADQSWIFPQGWFDAYNNPPAALIAVAPAAVRNAADPVAAYRQLHGRCAQCRQRPNHSAMAGQQLQQRRGV